MRRRIEPRSPRIEPQTAQAPVESEQKDPLEGKHLILYDGVCGLCNRTVQKIIARDRSDVFRFAPLQGDLAAKILERHGIQAIDLNSVYLVIKPNGPNETVFERSRAIGKTWIELGGLHKILGALVLSLRPLSEIGYRIIARNRYRWYGKFESCPLPSAAQRKKFLDL